MNSERDHSRPHFTERQGGKYEESVSACYLSGAEMVAGGDSKIKQRAM
jgi:hypothetical protein